MGKYASIPLISEKGNKYAGRHVMVVLAAVVLIDVGRKTWLV